MVRGGKSAKAKVEARPPVARKSRKIDGSTGRQLEQRLAEALEQQAATSEILHAISSSPTDLDPVFRMILANATRLCGASVATLWLFDGELLSSVAHQNASPEFAEYLARARIRPSHETTTRRAALERKTIHVADLLSDPDYSPPEFQRKEKVKTVLSVPLLRRDTLVGVVTLWRREVRPFTDRQVALVETFADQAVIAIENVRLFRELETRNRDLTEALEQQTATSDILRVISRSPTDLQPVFDAIVRSASHLCDGHRTVLVRLADDEMHLAAVYNAKPRTVTSANFPRRLGRELAVGRAILDSALVHIPDVKKDPEYSRDLARALELGSVLSVPLMRDGKPIGAIGVSRANPGSFPENRIQLLKTFADQAVIAIENVRLFKELETRNRDLTEALEQQTATSDILRVISQSPTDVRPVFDTIAAAALKLCSASSANVFTFDGELIHLAAFVNVNPEFAAVVRQVFPRPPGRDTAVGRVILARNIAAIPDVLEDREFAIGPQSLAGGFRSVLSVPLIRDGSPIGAISVGRPAPGPFPDKQVALLQTFADQAVIAIENVRLFKELESRNRDLTEALEQQTATSDILRVISSSPTDVQPVFDIIGESAERLCDADISIVSRIDGGLIQLVALHGVNVEGKETVSSYFPMRLDAETVTARSMRHRAVIHITDVLADPDYEAKDAALAGGYRGCLGVPMFREGQVIGSIFVARRKPGLFTDSQVQLLKTFADQAVIAIENVRLFNETREALERQTATAEILKVISSSPTDVQPVFGAIAERAAALCEAEFGFVTTYDGDVIHYGASVGPSPEALELHRAGYPMKPGTGSVTARVVLQGVPVQIEDMFADPEYEQKVAAERGGFRSGMGVPMLREGKVIGAIVVVRTAPGKFSERHVGLLQTFADQAVIAIENVRLFTELQARNQDLTIALDQKTATSEILRVISQSQTDVQPVFEAIVRSAVRLCGADHSIAARFDGELLHPLAHHGFSPEALKIVERMFPMRPGPENMLGRAALNKAIVNLPDMLADPMYSRDFAMAGGWRSGLGVPMLRDGELIGAIAVSRTEPGAFPDHLVALLTTFADQAVIAIENVRLFTELETRNRDVTEALEQQTATSDILRVISRSQRDVQPVFDTIAAAALKLCRANSAAVMTFDGELIHLVATVSVNPEGANLVRSIFPRPPGRDMAGTRAILTRSVVAIPDVLEDPDFSVKPVALATGFRSALSVPLMRDGSPIGAITAGRPEPGPFPDKQIALLQTFADQAVIAIENARLFKELEARTTDLTRSVGELKALGDVGQAVSSTLDLETVLNTIVSRATQLAGMDGGSIWEYDETREEFYLHAADKLPDELVEALRATPIRKAEGAVGRLAVTGEPVEIRDIADEGVYQSRVREILIRLGYRSLLAVPLLREDHLLGALAVNRKSAGEFAPEVIELLKTFATQSALAIQNARLFREIEDKGRQLEIASQHKSEFLANMSHELRTPLNAIIGFSEVLYERMFGEINDKQAEYLSDILESGRHLLSLINDILDLSKIEAGRMELEPSEFDLPTAIENTLILIRERAQRRGITLGRTVDERLGMIRADERKLKQVLLNLLSNALKFTPEGGQIDVRARVHNGEAEISVADTGVGIAPEDQEAVFEEFRQVGTTARKVEGTGLGLTISRKFIELHGGRIWVKSQPGIGSTFAFTLPLTIDQRHPTG
jgi:GAF domain-containing protein